MSLKSILQQQQKQKRYFYLNRFFDFLLSPPFFNSQLSTESLKYHIWAIRRQLLKIDTYYLSKSV